MSYILTKTNGTFLVEVQDNSVDTVTTSLYLFGENTKNYGQNTNQNFVNLLQTFSNSASPATPLQGQLWYDSENDSLKVYNGVLWDIVSPTFDGKTGIVSDLIVYDNIYSEVLYVISNSKIVSAYSSIALGNQMLPSNVTVNNINYQLQENFSNGLIAGITFANLPNVNVGLNSSSVSTEKLTKSSNIAIVGPVSGSVYFDGTSNVNVSITVGNIYIGNTNVTVSGHYSNVTVDHGGKIVSVGNITYNDIVSALEYIPYNTANIAYENIPNSVVFRNQNGDFIANEMRGSVQYAEKLLNGPSITITGDVEGASNAIVGNSNVVISSVRSVSSVTPGVYSSVTVNQQGIITAGEFLEQIPIGTVALYTNSVIPEGWARCDGSVVTTPTGQQIITPNLSNVIVGGAAYIVKVYSDRFLPSNDTIVGTLSVSLAGGTVPFVTLVGGPFINYPPLRFSNVNVGTSTSTVTAPYKVRSVELTDPGRGYSPGEKIYISPSSRSPSSSTESKKTVRAEIEIESVDNNGAIKSFRLANKGSYKDVIKMKDVELRDPAKTSGTFAKVDLKLEKELPLSVIQQSTVLVDIDFGEDLFFDATSLAIANGDPNAVFLSQLNIYGELKNLTISQILDNLRTRISTQLPGKLGKYMLSYEDILLYSNLLMFDIENTFFTTSVQNRLMYAKVADYANRFAKSGFYPTDDKLFGAILIGYERYVAILTSPRDEIVINSLTKFGYEPLQFSDNDLLPNAELLTYFSKIITNAKVSISNNRAARDVATTTNKAAKKNAVNVPNSLVTSSTFPTDNVQIILSEVIIDGLPAIVGNEVSTAQGGGSFANAGGDYNNVIYNLINQKRGSTVTANDPWHPDDGPVGGTSGGAGGAGSGGGGGGGGGGADSGQAANRPSKSTPTTPNSSSGTGTTSSPGIVGSTSTPSGVNNTPPSAPPPPSTTPTGVSGTMVSANMAVPSSTGVPNKDTVDLVSASVPPGYVAQVTPAGGKHSRTAGTQNHPGGYAADVVLIDKNTGKPAPPSVYAQYVENSASYVGKDGGIEAALDANGNIRFVHVNTPQGSGQTFMINHPDLEGVIIDGVRVQNGNIERLKGTKYQYIYDQAVAAGLIPGYQNGIKKASGTVPPSAPPPPPGGSVVSSGGKLPSAAGPVTAMSAQAAAAVVETITVLTETITKATTVVADLVQQGIKIATDVANFIKNVAESSGVTPPPSTKPPTGVGGTVVNAVRPSLPTSSSGGSGGSSGSSSSGGGGGGADSGQAANRPSTPGTISGVSANNNGSISVAAAPSTRNPTSSATYGISNSPSKPSSGGTGTSPKPSGGGGGADSGQAANKPAGTGCFVYETAIEMADGTTKQIGTIRLGDQTRGGEVLAIHCYDGAPLYNYRGVHVSGTHYVIENGEPIMVQDSAYAEKIDNVYGLYTIDTTERRIFANGIEFADHNGDGVIFDFFKNSNATTFNSEKEIFDEVLRQVKDAKL